VTWVSPTPIQTTAVKTFKSAKSESVVRVLSRKTIDTSSK